MKEETIEQIKNQSRAFFGGPDTEATPENIRDFISRMKGFYSEYNLDEDELFRIIEELHTITIKDLNILSEDEDHIEWFNDSTNTGIKRKIVWHFWEHFKSYLLFQKTPPRENKIVDKLNQFSSIILGRMEDPKREGKWDRRGMVVGNVQAGKTENYTALITKAADAGYKLIIILAGVHESLRCQTQIRLNEEFIGKDNIEGKEEIIGVKKTYPNHKEVFGYTTREEGGDFHKLVKKHGRAVPQTDGAPFLLVVKKNVSILKNIISWTEYFSQKTEKGEYIVQNIPLLLIDDECDYASVNTKKTERDSLGNVIVEWDPAQTNKQIRTLLHRFDRSIYVGYTATPYANIFINKDDYHPKYGDDIYPKHFLINLPHPQNYLGPEVLFGIEGDEDLEIEEIEALPLIREVDDNEEVIPSKHDNKYNISHLPESLKEALKSFVLTCAARRTRSKGVIHNSMLIHVTRFNMLQKQIAGLVQKEMQDLSARIMSNPNQKDLEILWENDFKETSEAMLSLGYNDSIPISWEDIKSELYEAASRIKVKSINGLAGDILDYKNVEIVTEQKIKNGEILTWGERGAHIIAIGGDKLSRGLTLEGLSVSYYLRASRMYDTLMQMGRWFGYREGYQDLCRIYTTNDLTEWYMHIAQANIELKNEFEYMENLGSTPENFGLKVRNHPGLLAVTSAGKSRQAERINLTYAGTSRGTILFDKKSSKNNFESLVSMINSIGRPPDNLNDRKRRGYLWNNLTPDLIINFLKSYNYPVKESKIFDPANIAKFIKKQIPQSELTEWSIFISSKNTDVFKKHKVGELEVACTQRTPIRKVENGKITLKGIINPPDELIYLTKDERDDLKKMYEKLVGKKNKKEKSFKKFALEKRSKKHGLLIIYLIANNGKETKGIPKYKDYYGLDEPVTGFLVSFPKSETAKTIEYMVNPIYFSNEES